MTTTVEITSRPALEAIDRIRRNLVDATPAMREIAALIEGLVEDSFSTQTDLFSRQKWDELSETTIARRTEAGTWPGRILQVTGGLAASVDSQHGNDFAVVGTNKVSAGTHQFGAKRGEYGTTSSGRPIPWGDIPARPFIPVSASGDINDDLEADILDVIEAHLSGR